eukprot:8826365-Pyramimonas_sp.AAC.1
MLVIRAGRPNSVSVASFGPLRRGCAGSLMREPRLRANCEEVPAGTPIPMGSPNHVSNPNVPSKSCERRRTWAP